MMYFVKNRYMKVWLIVGVILFLNGFLTAQRINFSSILAGAKIVEYTPNRIDKTSIVASPSALAIHDSQVNTGWFSDTAQKGPFVFVFEFSEEYWMEEVVFYNTTAPGNESRSSKDVSIEIAQHLKDKEFKRIANYTLEPNKETRFVLQEPYRVRKLKLIIYNNHGSPDYTTLKEFQVLGKFSDAWFQDVNIVGSYKSNAVFSKDSLAVGTERLFLKMNRQGYIYACNDSAYLKLDFYRIKRKVFDFVWENVRTLDKGTGTMILNKEGTAYRGVIYNGKDQTKLKPVEWLFQNNKTESCFADSFFAPKLYPYYDFIKKDKIEKANGPGSKVKLKFVDALSGEPLQADYHLFFLKNHKETARGTAASNGNVSIQIPIGEPMQLQSALMGYISSEESFEVSDFTGNEFEKIVALQKITPGQNIVLKHVLFKQGTTELLDSSYIELNKLSKFLSEHEDINIEIAGHTDNQGDSKKNQLLSEQRAAAIKNYLVQKGGIKSSRIQSLGYGGSKPIADNSSEVSRKLNRRVEFKILEKKK